MRLYVCMVDICKTPRRSDVKMAKLAIHWDDETDNRLIRLWPHDNNPAKFSGTDTELSRARRAMKRYEEQAGKKSEAYYKARHRLKYTEVGGPAE